MNLGNLIDEIMGRLNFDELEIRELENGCDFDGTLKHYRSVIKDNIRYKSEHFDEEEFSITDEAIEDIINEVQDKIDNDYSCEE